MELLLRASTVGLLITKFNLFEYATIVLFTTAIAGALYFIKVIFSPKAGKVIYGLLMFIIGFYYGAQIVYYSVFGTFFTAYSVVNGGVQAFEFYEVVLTNLWDEKISIALLIAVGLFLIIFTCKKCFNKAEKYNDNKRYYIIICMLLIISTTIGSISMISIENENPKSSYQKVYVTGEIKGYVESCGLLTASVIDTYRYVFGFEPKLQVSEEVVEVQQGDNIIDDIDFNALIAAEQNETIKTMHQYFGSQTPTKTNEKTGIFEGKNLIFITAESFTDFAVNEKYTPTLYKMKQEGYTFSNYYNPIWGVSTIDGEYVNLQGLVPKPGVWSMKESAQNSLPLTLGNQFSAIGYETKAYHNHSVYYYNRDISHPNLGYDFKGQGREYSFENIWPESDVEMVDKTTSDFLNAGDDGNIEPFHVYYLTVSGHLNYNFYGNVIAMRNKELVADMELSDACKAYMATQIEFDKAMELLIERLDEAGVLEDTVIAIAGDHYPYGLTTKEISEFKGHNVDEEYEMFESEFIIWTPNMKAENIDKVGSNIDILPTLSNLFGLEYDSRLLMGKDLFSDSEGFVVFKDKNWISDRGTRSELEAAEATDYIAMMDKRARDMFNYSALILDHNYYSYFSKAIKGY